MHDLYLRGEKTNLPFLASQFIPFANEDRSRRERLEGATSVHLIAFYDNKRRLISGISPLHSRISGNDIAIMPIAWVSLGPEYAIPEFPVSCNSVQGIITIYSPSCPIGLAPVMRAVKRLEARGIDSVLFDSNTVVDASRYASPKVLEAVKKDGFVFKEKREYPGEPILRLMDRIKQAERVYEETRDDGGFILL